MAAQAARNAAGRAGVAGSAIGLAQTRKLPYILAQQRKHKAIIQERLSKIPGLQFRRHTDEAGVTTSYDYTGFDELETLTSPDTGVTGYTYDPAGNLATRTDVLALLPCVVGDAHTQALCRLPTTTPQLPMADVHAIWLKERTLSPAAQRAISLAQELGAR